jgi:hypothetical protein
MSRDPEDPEDLAEQPLAAWGSGRHPSDVARSGEVVLRPSGAWTPAVLALLRHLEDAGFPGSPRVVGDGYAADGRMAVSYVPGGSPHPGPWPDDQVGRIGALLRSLHDASASFVAPGGAAWKPWWLRQVPAGGDVVIGHGDAGPWNIVGRGGRPEALIDWEYAGPVDRISELAYAVWLNAQLHDDDIAELQGLPSGRARARQAHSIMDGYRLPAAGRGELIDRMIEVAVHDARAEAVMANVTPDSTEAVGPTGYPVLWAITWRARSASWMMRNRAVLIDPAA